MIILQQYPSAFGLPSLSPFCTKVETYLKLVRLPYEIQIVNNPNIGPKGKMPVLKDGETIIPDSSFIIQYLKNNYGDPLDHDLTASLAARAICLQRLIEENLYYVILYSRWIDPAGKAIIDQSFQQFFPKVMAPILLLVIRNQLKRQAWAQGISRHRKEEVYEIGLQDIHAITTLLSEQAYALDDQPRSIDASLYAFLSTIIHTPIDTPIRKNLLGNDLIQQYVARMENHLQQSAPLHSEGVITPS